MLASRARPTLDPIRILVVDDEADICDVTAILLRSYGAYVESACSAKEARQRLSAHRFDVLLSDISMPGEDGYALLRSIRSGGGEHAAITAAAVTARLSPRDRREAIECGFDCIVGKPFTIEALVATVLELWQRHQRSVVE
jgi:CheY-like chemotaxis protein